MKKNIRYVTLHDHEKERVLSWLKRLDPVLMRLLIMRINLTILIVCFALMNVWAKGYAQGINLTFEKVPIKDVIDQIAKQSGYPAMYNSAHLSKANKVTIHLKNATLQEALDKCLENQPLAYEIMDKTIVITLKVPSIRERIINFLKTIKISGRINDNRGKPISGVHIREKGADNFSRTEADGTFHIEVNDQNAILILSCVGFETKEYALNGNSTITIYLKEAISELKEFEVVSTGFQTIPKERATGSFVQLNNDLVERRVSTNILDRLEGITSGLVMNRNYSAGNPNSSPFSIRGLSTIYANAKPLIVVDNFPFDGDITNLNPNDVESITVLKDATAASIWGARSGNGVIVITTKKGRQNNPLSISLNSNINISERPDIYYGQSFLDANGFIEAEQFLFSKGYYDSSLSNTTTRPVVSPVVEILAKQRAGTLTQADAESQINAFRGMDVRDDISKYFYRSTASQQYALNLSAGGDKYSYYVSGGYDRSPSVIVGNDYNRTSLTSSFNFTPIKNLEITAGINYALTDLKNNSIQGAIAPTGKSSYYPYADLVDENGNAQALPKDYRQSYINNLGTSQLLDWEYRPYDEIRNNDNRTKANYARINAGLKYTFIPGLSLDVKYQLEKQNSTRLNLQNQQSYFTRNLINLNTQISGTTITRPVPLGAILDNERNELTGNSFRSQINYNNIFSDQYEITAIAGIDAKEVKADQYQNRVYGYDPLVSTIQQVDFKTSFTKYAALASPGTIPFGATIAKTTDEFFSYFANASYTYLKRYTISGSGRIDQSNLFGVNTNQKSVPLWSAGLAWDVSKEHFFKTDWISYLKLRTTYGYNGNIDKTISAFTTGVYATANITGAPQVVIQNPPNPELRWERIGMFNVGLDVIMLNGLLRGSVDYYHKNAKDLIGFAAVDPTAGVKQFKGNVGSMKGNGLDVDLTFTAGNKLRWEGNLLYSYANNKVTQYRPITAISALLQGADGYVESQVAPVVGKPVFSVFSFPWAGLNPADGSPQGYINGQITSDYTSLLNSTDLSSLTFNGSSRPTSFGSFRNSIEYAGLSLSLNITYKFGYYFRRPALNYATLAASYTGYAEFSKRWTKPGDEAFTNVPSFVYPFPGNRDTFYQYSSINIEKGDHIRLQDVQLNYNLKKLVRSPFKVLNVYGYLNNLGIIWKATKTKIDPDFIRDSYVAPQTYALGIKATF